ncbi:MAG: hypothetical protein SF339_22865 [Blastocatellia bacterium]|nr:hypothetical protein [Blastocatellia bacterium]
MSALELAIGHVPIIITARSPFLVRLFADYFRYYDPRVVARSGHSDGVWLDLQVRRELPRERLFPAGAELISQTGVVRLLRERTASGERYYFDLEGVAFRVDPAENRATGLVTEEALRYPHILANTYALFALLLLLRARGQYHLHAAAVVSPRDELWLICGAPRAGKTTLATALGLAGWRPISDDSLLVSHADGHPRLTAFRKYFHIGDALFERWDALQSLARHRRNLDRTCAEALEFFGTRPLAERVFDRVDHLLLPQISAESHSRLEPLPRSQALLKYAEQSMFFQLWPEHTERQWNALTALTRGATCHRFLSGPDILADPARAAEMLQERE